MNYRRNEGLDIFRGIAIASMIVVNNQGDWGAVYRSLRHAGWFGFNPADMIFPAFLFVAGISLHYFLKGAIESGISRPRVYALLLRRALLIFLLGLSLNVPLDLNMSIMRFTGVLQRIAICLAVSAVPLLWLRHRGVMVSAIGFSLVYWIVVLTIEAPGFLPGDLSTAGSIAGYIDMHILGPHRYRYGNVPGFDPEGLLSTLGAISTTLLGVAIAPILRSERPWPERLRSIAICGVLLTVTGLLLSNSIPLSKPLWTPSYVMLTSGISCLILFPLCYFADYRRFGLLFLPLRAMGISPLILYYLSSLAGNLSVSVKISEVASGLSIPLKQRLFSMTFAHVPGPAGSLLYSLLFLLIFLILAMIIMYTKQWLSTSRHAPFARGGLALPRQ